MTWLRKLLGIGAGGDPATPRSTDSAAESSPQRPDRITIKHYGEHVVSVRSIDFTGQFADSPNRRFTLLWQDRTSINEKLRGGRYVLIQDGRVVLDERMRSEEHTSELQLLMRISYAVFCLNKKTRITTHQINCEE